MKLFLHKLFHWEYWPFKIVYIPVYFQWIYYSVRARSLFFFNACNPGMKNGGFMAESKMEIYDIIPNDLYPPTCLVSEAMDFNSAQSAMNSAGIRFPAIAKPDIGLRGSAVRKIHSEEELLDYHSRRNFSYLIQQLIPYPNEVGIFYVRFPNESAGRITGIVSKEFLAVTGDGKATVEQLLQNDPRHAMQLPVLRKDKSISLGEVPSKGEKVVIVPYGNHARGAKFYDHSHLISDKLTATLNNICNRIPGFYFGRLDIMYSTFAQLESGLNFAIVEINGASSEPTHIYDPKHSLFFAWKELIRHTDYMFRISLQNKKAGIDYLSHGEGMREYRIHLEQNRRILNF